MPTARRIKTLYIVLSVVIIAVLLYQRVELGRYRASTVDILANQLSVSLRMASADMERALEAARKSDYEATSQWLTTVATDMASAQVAERVYNQALDRRLGRDHNATGFGMALSLYGSIAKSDAIGVRRNGWTHEIESELSAMGDDLKLMANMLTEELFRRTDYAEIRSVGEAVKQQLKTEAIR